MSENTKEKLNPDTESYKLLSDAAREYQDIFRISEDALETKARTIIGYAGIIIGLMAASGKAIFITETASEYAVVQPNSISMALFVLSSFFFMICVLLLLKSTRVFEYTCFAQPMKMFRYYASSKFTDACHGIIRDRQNQINCDKNQYQQRTTVVKFAYSIFVIGIVFLLGAILSRWIVAWAGPMVIIVCWLVYKYGYDFVINRWHENFMENIIESGDPEK